MAQIPQYTKGIIRQRQVAQPFNPSAIEAAGQNYAESFAQVADWADKYAVAEETTAVNEALIRKQKDDFDFLEAKKTEWQNNPTGFSKTVETELAKRNEQYMATLPSSRAKEAFKQSAMRIDLGTYEQSAQWEKKRGVEIIGNRLDSSFADLEMLASKVGSYGGDFEQIKNNLDASIIAAETVMAKDEVELLKKKQLNQLSSAYLSSKVLYDPQAIDADLRSGKFDDYLDGPTRLKLQNLAYDSLPDLKKLEGGYKPDGSFASAMAIVETNEGGYTSSDGASGAPAIYGINAKWHPEAFAEAKQITTDYGEAEGKKYAREFYKKEYWDKYGIESLPEETRAIVMDGVVNHRVDFASELADKAKAGATQQELLDMRRDEYLRLAKSPQYAPSLNSWMNRLNRFKRVGSVEEMEKAAKRVADDPVKALAEIGMKTTDEFVAYQVQKGISPKSARVLSNSQVEQFSNTVANLAKTDDIVSFANSLRDSYSGYEGNALHDLISKGKVAPTKAAALSLAMKNQVQYRQHIDLLMNADEKTEKESFRTMGNSETDLSAAVADKFDDMVIALRSEGYKPQEINAQMQITKGLARSYMLANTDADYSDAVDFALTPENESYKIDEFNGTPYRIPTKYDVDKITSNLPEIYSNVIAPLKKKYEESGYTLEDDVQPFLNADETAIGFRTITGEPILLDNGAALEISLDAIENYTRPKVQYSGIPIMRGGF